MLKGISASMMPRQSVHVFTKKYGFTKGIEAVISTISFPNVEFLGCLLKVKIETSFIEKTFSVIQ